MTKPSCEDIRNMLVDYGDGVLSEHEAQIVADHLASCPACQTTAAALTRSLGLAQAIWRDNLESAAPLAGAGGTVRRALPRGRYLAVAAALLITTGGTFFLCMLRPTPPSPPTPQEVEQYAARTGAAAQLLAATQLLAKCEGTESIVARQCRYILDNYADTPAAAALRTANPLKFGETNND
jgi:anti-sigma factor RsiW